MEFLNLKKEIFGMDISDLSIKIVQLKEKKGKFYFSSFGVQKLEEGIIEGGEIKDEEKLIFFIKKAIKEVKGEKLKTKYVNCCLPEEKAFLQVIKLPKMPDEDLQSAILFEVENYIPVPLSEVYLDWEKIEDSSSQTQEILIAACPKKICDAYFKVLKKANLEPLSFEIETIALARALVPKTERNSTILILDVGETKTAFCIFSKNSLRFTCTIPISGRLLTQTLAKSLKISFESAERLKKEIGIKGILSLETENKRKILKPNEQETVEALLPPLIDLSQQARRIISFFETHNGKEKIEKILLSGGGANLKGLDKFLEFKLNIPVEIGNPLVNLPLFRPPNLSFEEIISFSTAIGLAMRKQ